MKRGSGERGQGGPLELLAGVLITAALAGALLAIPALRDIGDASNAWENERKKEAGYAEREQFPYIGPQLPTATKAHDCTVEMAASHGLTWTSRGWRAPGRVPEPTLTGLRSEDKGLIAAWKDQMVSYVATFEFEFERCNQPELAKPGDPNAEPTTSMRQSSNWSGTYALDIQSQSPGCGAFPNQATVSHSGSTVRVTIRAITAEGPIDRDNAFDIDKTVTDGDVSATIRMRGRFDLFGETRIWRSGVFEFTQYGQTCSVAFEGRAS